MRKALITAAIVAAMLVPATAASAGRWATQVTGSGTFFDNVQLDVSSRQDADGSVKGQIQYTRPDLTFHIDVDCVFAGDDGYAFSGPAKMQDGTYPSYVSVEISYDGTGVRVHDVSPSETCGYSGDYKATVPAGSFNIR